ncbi:hypothetical protein [Rhizobium terrae]|nr:hypothetical protein [Rhizobium terrae]
MQEKEERRIPPEPGTDDARSADTERSRKEREAAREKAAWATEKIMKDEK